MPTDPMIICASGVRLRLVERNEGGHPARVFRCKRSRLPTLPGLSGAFALALLACSSPDDTRVCSEAGARMVACGLALPAKYVCLPDSEFDHCWAACVADANCEDLTRALCMGAATEVLDCASSCTTLPGKCEESKLVEQCRSLSCDEPGEAQTCWWSRGPKSPMSCGR